MDCLVCLVCREALSANGDHIPLMLPCDHIICRQCVIDMWTLSKEKSENQNGFQNPQGEEEKAGKGKQDIGTLFDLG